MSWMDVFGKKIEKEGQNNVDSTATSQTPTATFDPSSLNFPGLMSGAPQVTAPVPDRPVAPVFTQPFAEPPEQPTPDPVQDHAVIEEAKGLARKARANASAYYTTFNATRERMMKANNGQPVPLNLVLAAASVSGRQLVQEVAGFETGLRTALTERDQDIGAEEQQALTQLDADVELLRGEAEQKTARISELTVELTKLRGEVSDVQQQLASKGAAQRTERGRFAQLRQRVRLAASRVATELTEEKRIFMSY